VFSLVSEDEISLAMLTLILLKLKQRACEWRGEIAKKALLAVKHFFDSYEELTTPTGRVEYVSWAVPQATYHFDVKGRRYINTPAIYPYMWEIVTQDVSGGGCVS
jgi:hypothetical protein